MDLADTDISPPAWVHLVENEYRNNDALLYSAQTAEESLDRLQALHTALCYLCSIHAHVSEIESFLCTFPEALLLEKIREEESAHSIIIEQEHHNKNQYLILAAIGRGFQYYQLQSLDRSVERSRWSSENLRPLVAMEEEIRKLRFEKNELENKTLELALQMKMLDGELKLVELYSQDAHRKRHFFAVSRKNEIASKRSDLQYHRSIVALALSSVERERRELLWRTRQIRRKEFFCLNDAFQGVQRCLAHVYDCCNATRLG